jgi:hypothetical protein
MDISTLLKPEIAAALTGAPLVLQWVKKIFPAFTGAWAAILAPLISAGLILSQAWGLCTPACMVFQIIVGWIWIEVMYIHVVEPMSKTTNPIVPDA